MKKAKLLEEITRLQGQLNIMNSAPEDTFNLGTIVVFASGPSGVTKWYYRKTSEETWASMAGGSEKSLAEWILGAKESNIGYFEVYPLLVQEQPIYASD